MLAVAATASVISAAAGVASAQSAAEGVKVQKRTQELETRRARQQARAEARAARAKAVAGATATGSEAGSGLAGVTGSVTSQEAANQTYLGQRSELSGKYFDAKISEAVWSGASASFGAIGSFAYQYAKDSGRLKPKPAPATTGANSAIG